MSTLQKLDLRLDMDSRLAVDLATQIYPMEDILSRYGLTRAEIKAKLQNKAFRQMVLEAKQTWESDLSAKDRIRLKSQLMVENSLEELYHIFHDKTIAPPARLDAFKTMARTAAVDSADKSGEVADKVTVNINLGEERPAIVLEADSQRVIEE